MDKNHCGKARLNYFKLLINNIDNNMKWGSI